MIIFSFKTDIGKVRKKNEDAFGHLEDELFLARKVAESDHVPTTRATEGSLFVVVADGLGGLPAGEVAAQLAIKTAIDVYQESKNLKRAFEMANHEIYRESRENPAYFGMATTLVGAVIEGRFATLANVGDSRAYLISGKHLRGDQARSGIELGKTNERSRIVLQQITIDHGLGGGVVTRVLGINPEVKVDVFKKELKSGDLLLLCTDGLTNMLSDGEILKILKDSGETEKAIGEKAKELIDAANAAGGFDNITVCLVKRV